MKGNRTRLFSLLIHPRCVISGGVGHKGRTNEALALPVPLRRISTVTGGLEWHSYGYGSIPINTIFSGMNIHLPAILMFTRGTRFWHTAISIKAHEISALESQFSNSHATARQGHKSNIIPNRNTYYRVVPIGMPHLVWHWHRNRCPCRRQHLNVGGLKPEQVINWLPQPSVTSLTKRVLDIFRSYYGWGTHYSHLPPIVKIMEYGSPELRALHRQILS